MKILVMGSGAWGTTLAQVLVDNGNDVLLYSKDQIIADEINNEHTNKKYLGETLLNEKLVSKVDYSEFLNTADGILLAVPSIAVESLINELIPKLHKKYIFINVIKGFVGEDNLTMLQYLRKIVPPQFIEGLCSLIGPSYAEEVVVRHITTIDAVSMNTSVAKKVQKAFSNSYFRVYTNKDEIGSEIASAYKNAIAIGSGILFGLGFGQNARAALITRGIHEMRTFGMFFGGQGITYLGLTGLGDLVLTCNSNESRNFSFGEAIGKTKNVDEVIKNNTKTVEGYRTIKCLYELSIKNNIYTPIVWALHEVLYNKADLVEILGNLMTRPLGPEFKSYK